MTANKNSDLPKIMYTNRNRDLKKKKINYCKIENQRWRKKEKER